MADLVQRRLRIAAAGTAAACALPMALHVPLPLSVTLGAAFALGGASNRRWPAWLRALLLVALCGLVLTQYQFRLGRDVASALLLAMLALKTFEVSTPRDLRSLVGFSLFAPFAAFLQDQGPVTLALSVPAVIAVLVSCALLAEDGVVEGRKEVPMRQRLRTLAATLAMALPLALAGFWLFPRLASPLWGMPENAVARTGLNDRMAPGEMLDLMNDDRPAFRVRFLSPAPREQEMYWRGPVLSHFDGRAWTRLDWAPPAPVTPEPATTLHYEITLEPTERPYLFALDLPRSISADARTDVDRTVTSRRAVTQVLRYEARSAPEPRFEADLPSLRRQTTLRLPPGFNPRTLALARSWREEGADDQEVIRRALAWINAEFIYTLESPLLGRNSVDEFLFDSQAGFCEHFSSSFAVLMRAAGIPARVVTGYAGAYRNEVGEFWLVRNSDAHAWTEVWLPERGWVRIDPTAAVAPERIFESLDQGEANAALAAMTRMGDFGDWALGSWNDFVLQFNAARQRSLLRPLGIDQATGAQLGLAFAVGAGLALALTLFLLLRAARPQGDPVLRAWWAFARQLEKRGLGKETAEPAGSYGARLAAALPSQAGELHSLSRRFADWRYAAREWSMAEREELARDLRRFRVASGPRPRQGVRP